MTLARARARATSIRRQGTLSMPTDKSSSGLIPKTCACTGRPSRRSASFYGSEETERARQAVNHWIRTSGWFDRVIDFDAATRDPQHPANLAAQADSGDHLHPADAGYKIMAASVDLNLFAN